MDLQGKTTKIVSTVAKRKSWFGVAWLWSKRVFGFLIASVLCFAAAAWILGNTPVNQAFRHADAENGIDILVINNGVHVDLVLPIDEPIYRWHDRFQSTDFQSFTKGQVTTTFFEHATFGPEMDWPSQGSEWAIGR